MKKQGGLIFICFIIAGVFAGILSMQLFAGIAVADRGGFPQCKADLNACVADLNICLETPSLVPKSGQMACYAPGDDGQLQFGLTWPDERFTDNMDGTVTDNLTGLIWTKNANCTSCNWYCAVDYCKTLAHGSCDLADESIPSDWRLPNAREFSSLIDYGNNSTPLPPDHPFVDISWYYWTSTTRSNATLNAWYIMLEEDGILYPFGSKYNALFNVWCVKGGL